MSGWTVIKASVPSLNAMIKPFEDEMEHVVDLVEKDFDSSVATFSNKPAFKKEVKTTGVFNIKITGSVWTEDEVYGYLNDGTGVRYATMTPNFVPKTKPGRIAARGGMGGVAYVSRSRPRPGIKARKWDVIIAKSKERNMSLAFARAIEKSIRISGHRY